MAIFEIIEASSELREKIKSGNFENNIQGLKTLASQAKEVYKQGLTSYSEILPILLND
jgi:type II secretory ATPase GspE/PulE/Tfp pilus assembly ATPase PilB-like protein